MFQSHLHPCLYYETVRHNKSSKVRNLFVKISVFFFFFFCRFYFKILMCVCIRSKTEDSETFVTIVILTSYKTVYDSNVVPFSFGIIIGNEELVG